MLDVGVVDVASLNDKVLVSEGSLLDESDLVHFVGVALALLVLNVGQLLVLVEVEAAGFSVLELVVHLLRIEFWLFNTDILEETSALVEGLSEEVL